MVTLITKICNLISEDVMVQVRCVFASHFPVHMQWINMRQTSVVSQTLNETTGFGSIFSPVNDFP